MKNKVNEDKTSRADRASSLVLQEHGSLRERAANAAARQQIEQEAASLRRFEQDKAALVKLLARVLGVESDSFKQDAHGRATATVDGLTFGFILDDFTHSLTLLDKCDKCGEEKWARISSVVRLGEILSDPTKFYHYCSPKPLPQENTPEARFLAALKEIITVNVPA